MKEMGFGFVVVGNVGKAHDHQNLNLGRFSSNGRASRWTQIIRCFLFVCTLVQARLHSMISRGCISPASVDVNSVPGQERRGQGGYKRRREEDEDATVRPKGPDAVLTSAIKLCKRSTVSLLSAPCKKSPPNYCEPGAST